MDYKVRYIEYKSLIENCLRNYCKESKPKLLYQPIRYILDGGGKRIRPILVMLSCEAVGGKAEDATYAACAIELLHNFTLVHDDIMDNAETRRGRATIHKKWDTSIAILSGDALICVAYQALLKTQSPYLQRIAELFTEGVLEVCEGQTYDKEFEKRKNVSVEEYMLMIAKKTGMLVAVSTQIGALIVNGNKEQIEALRAYGVLVGRAFQIQDDLLDCIADEKEFGKKIGSDLREGKKTFLLLDALRKAKGTDRKMLKEVVQNKGIRESQIKKYLQIFNKTGAIETAKRYIESDINDAKVHLNKLNPSPARDMLFWFTDMLLKRSY